MSAGMLDATFNPSGSPPGTATVAINTTAQAYSALVQPSGKIILTGKSVDSSSNPHIALAEFDANGSLDPGFGSGAIVGTTAGKAPYWANKAVLYPTGTSGDEKILVAGFGNSTFALARYNADGSLDTSFGSGGSVGTNFNQKRAPEVNGLVLIPNGTLLPKIVEVGSSSNDAGIELARYNPDGSLDTSFGSKGTVYAPISGGIGVSALALDSVSGDLIVAGGSLLVAFRSSGALDTSFGTNGVVTTAVGNESGLAVYPAADTSGNAGKILVAGNGMGRYNVNGTLDTSWGGTGTVTTGGSSLALQADKVLAAGGWSVARLNTDGSLDSSFGSGGIATIGLANTITYRYAVALQPNGAIVEGGATIGSGGHDVFGVARLLPSEPEIGTFTASQSAAGAPVTLTASNITDGNPNSTISQVTFFYYDSGGNKIVVGSATAPDGSGNWTVSASLPPGSYTLYAQATDSYGVLGDPLAYTLTIQ